MSNAHPARTQVPMSTARHAYVPGAVSVRVAESSRNDRVVGSVPVVEDRDDDEDMGVF
jgi:hypothetical protein